MSKSISSRRIMVVLCMIILLLLSSMSVSASAPSESKKSGFVTIKKQTYYYDQTGRKMHGLKKLTGKDGKKHWYLFDSKSGAMQTGFQYLKSKKRTVYFRKKTGEMLTGKQKINGTVYRFDKKNGALIGINKKTDLKANTRLNQLDRKLRKAYEWSANITYVHYTEDRNKGIAYYADHGFQYRSGNCYCKAATFVAMARQLGYRARQMGGYVRSIYGGRAAHSWCEIYYKGAWRVCDPSFGQKTGNGWLIHYGQKGTWVYMDYKEMKN